mmetsp:Transcript_4731/g.5682  ORF Transcript_4731/g.5682 Transcript_4731/m.5682 type:complete len:130 (+) Transcript_4731:3-392(+)
MLYVGSFFVTFTFPAIINFVGEAGMDSFVLMLLMQITLPLQGFWNFIAYIRPRLHTLQERFRGKSLIWYMLQLFSPEDESPSKRKSQTMFVINSLREIEESISDLATKVHDDKIESDETNDTILVENGR